MKLWIVQTADRTQWCASKTLAVDHMLTLKVLASIAEVELPATRETMASWLNSCSAEVPKQQQ